VPLNAAVTFDIRNTVRQVRSRNVVAKLEGSDPKLESECIVYSAHWDHLGRNENLKGDQIYNGALDNASGTAGLLEIAKAYGMLRTPPQRTIIFLAPTAEEKGLLGARYYIENPLRPLSRTLADINMDCLNPWGRTRDLIVIGSTHSFLDDIVSRVARSQGRRIVPDLEPEKGFFFRSDQFEFARHGIATLYTDGGIDLIGKPVQYGLRKRSEYTRRDYHKVTDEVKPDWDLSGAVEDLRLFFLVGYEVAAGNAP
jgi:Zn-dependent M28 family amino/carboxypeptidase